MFTQSKVSITIFLLCIIFSGNCKLRADEPKIVKVIVIVHTETDDKDKEEEVTIQILYGKRILAEKKAGAGDRWPDQDKKEFTLELKRGIPESKSDKGRIRISKSCHGSETGCGWDMSIEVQGVSNDDTSAELLPRTKKNRVGDNNPTSYEFYFQKIED